jgi:hypothetical protein
MTLAYLQVVFYALVAFSTSRKLLLAMYAYENFTSWVFYALNRFFPTKTVKIV